MLAPESVLPDRAEIVALADALAIASARAGKTAEGGGLARLAGDLRLRSWRVGQSASDAREAVELYAAAAATDPTSEDACEADRQRALLVGELAEDAWVSYRELYLVARRRAQAGAAGGPRSACLDTIERQLAQAVAFRPRGAALEALEAEAQAGAPVAATAPATLASAAASAVASAAPPSRDVVVAPQGAEFDSGPVRITSIERYGSDKGGRIVVRLSAPTTFTVGTLGADEGKGKDNRIFIDIARATSRGILREQEVGGAIRRVRVGKQPKGTRVVLDLETALYRRIFYLPDPFRIVIDVSTRPPERSDKPREGGAGREVRRVVIDAGHGGIDAGALGPTGLREKDVTLDIAHRIAPILAHEHKIEVLLTRDTDAFVPLDERTARANAFHADLFVSIHCNASENGQASGVQTFHLDHMRDPTGFAAKVAARENAARPQATLDSASLDRELSAVLSNLNIGDMAARSRHLADLVHRSALASVATRYADTRDQGVKSAGFFVLVGADMPAVLFETAFISNPDDERRLATADYRQKMADAIVNAIRAYREGK
jgi:N-acetylmuramoyl-L-alanine amidase